MLLGEDAWCHFCGCDRLKLVVKHDIDYTLLVKTRLRAAQRPYVPVLISSMIRAT